MAFTKDPEAHRALIDAVYSDEPYDADAWLELHLNRNEYNVGHVPQLTHSFGRWWTDSAGRTWTEVPVFMNKYHMSDEDFRRAMNPLNGEEPYSRKFLARDHETGLEGEFEMIIRSSDRKRIDALTHEIYQETYNFGPTLSSPLRHAKLDIDPHTELGGDYAVRTDRGYTRIHNPSMLDGLRSFGRDVRGEFNRGVNRYTNPRNYLRR